jgi:hypothetical protein
MRLTILTALFLLLVVTLNSCIKLESLPPEPSIEYRSFKVFDTTDILGNRIMGGKLTFYFEDGDGDLGLPAPENQEEPDTINLFVSLFRVNDGTITPAPDDDPFKTAGFRIPFMDRVGRYKILRGDISVVFLYLFYSREDTIRYDFYIKDRAGNISNTVSSSLIPVFFPGTYTE